MCCRAVALSQLSGCRVEQDLRTGVNSVSSALNQASEVSCWPRQRGLMHSPSFHALFKPMFCVLQFFHLVFVFIAQQLRSIHSHTFHLRWRRAPEMPVRHIISLISLIHTHTGLISQNILPAFHTFHASPNPTSSAVRICTDDRAEQMPSPLRRGARIPPTLSFHKFCSPS